MIRIDVTGDVLSPEKPTQPRKQVAFAFLAASDGKPLPHPEKVYLPLWEKDQPYAPGTYTLAPQSFKTDKWRELSLSPKLVPVSAAR